MHKSIGSQEWIFEIMLQHQFCGTKSPREGRQVKCSCGALLDFCSVSERNVEVHQRHVAAMIAKELTRYGKVK
jgi:hypothetical protein